MVFYSPDMTKTTLENHVLDSLSNYLNHLYGQQLEELIPYSDLMHEEKQLPSRILMY